MSLQLYITLYPFFHKKYGQKLSIILFAFFFYLFYIPKTQYYIFIAVFYFTLYHFLSSGALFHLCLQHKKRRRMDFRVRSAALLVLENETGGVTFPHLLTMGDGCPFRPQISFHILYAICSFIIQKSWKMSRFYSFQCPLLDKIMNPVMI